MGVMAERFTGAGDTVQWTNYLFAGSQMVGVFIERSDETVATRYFHMDHLGSISVITDENGQVVERLSYDAWGLRRHPDGTPDPAGAFTSEATRGFTGHEHLADVGLIHMNGRVYDPLLGRFGTPDPMTENPFSTQGWNRYSYVGNSPVNFTDPSGYCFLGCLLKEDFDHYAPTFFRTETAFSGTLFFVQPKGSAGQFSSLWQYAVPGGLRGQPGIVEYILDPWWSNTLTHQRFIPGGTITGFSSPGICLAPKN